MTASGDVRTRLRAADDRVPTVERALLAARLGLVGDDLDLLLSTTVTDLLELPSSVTLTIAAARLLEHLDAHVARRHPVDLEYGDDVTVVRVPLGDDDERGTVTAALQHEPSNHARWLVVLEVDDAEAASLDLDEANHLAYALLRLVAHAEEEEGTP